MMELRTLPVAMKKDRGDIIFLLGRYYDNVNRRNRRGLSVDPCGVPDLTCPETRWDGLMSRVCISRSDLTGLNSG